MGLRILGVAKSSFNDDDFPEKQHDFQFEFIGLLGFLDNVRPGVNKALSDCYTAGIRVIMITGDYPGTAQHIARQIGLKNPENYLTGAQISVMEKAQLQERINTINIFARVVPEQKLALVEALKSNGEIVAMTGDGVNDAPALKAAHIGIAMGERGTDVARESAAIVLLNDDFSSIVEAVRMGRRIFDNLKKAISYIFSVHVPIAGLALFPVMFNLPLILLPAHIAFLELIIDPACSTVFEAEPEEKNIMKRPPRDLKEKLFGKEIVFASLLQGISVLVVVIFIFLLALTMGKSDMEARSLTFATLVIANLTLIIAGLSWETSLIRVNPENKALWLVIAGALGSLVLVLNIPVLRNLFHFSQLHLSDIMIVFLAGISSVLWFKVLNVRVK
jgi:P-type Ca2+ transporter type 2C